MWTYLRLSVLSLALWTFPLLSQGAVVCGSFSHVEGDVTFQIKDKGEGWESAELGGKICPGATVATTSSGRASIKFPGGEELHISPKSQLLIAAMESDAAQKKKKALMNLLNGKVRANIPPGSYKSSSTQFRIKSETAVAGVRGTQFVMSYSAQSRRSEVVTLRGAVEVGRPAGRGFGYTNPVLVRPGQKTTATPQAPPAPPVDLPADEFKNVDDSTASTGDAPSDTDSSEPVNAGPAETDTSSDTASEPATSPAEPVAQEPAERSEPADRREPASAPPPPTMVAPADLAPPPDALSPDLLLNRPIGNQLPPPVVCEFCDDRILDGPARIKLKVRRGDN